MSCTVATARCLHGNGTFYRMESGGHSKVDGSLLFHCPGKCRITLHGLRRDLFTHGRRLLTCVFESYTEEHSYRKRRLTQPCCQRRPAESTLKDLACWWTKGPGIMVTLHLESRRLCTCVGVNLVFLRNPTAESSWCKARAPLEVLTRGLRVWTRVHNG